MSGDYKTGRVKEEGRNTRVKENVWKLNPK